MADLSSFRTVIKNIQRGGIAIPDGETSEPATITSVDTSKSFIVFGGVSINSTNYYPARLYLTNATTVTATRDSQNGSDDTSVTYEVVEFY